MTRLLEGKNAIIHGAATDLVESLDVSWNLTSRGSVQGTPLIDMTLADFLQPIRAAARIMVEQGSGVILAMTSGSSAGTNPMTGGTGPADAATEIFLRYRAKEIGPRRVHVVGLWTAGVPETFGLPDDTNEAMLGPMTMLGHAPRLDQVADAAAFLASDRAGGITGIPVTVTCGLVPG